MVVSSCPPSLHWERHQLLGLRMAIGVVSCEIGDTPASSFSSPLPLRSQVFAAFDGYEASLLLFPAVAVSGTIGYMKGYNFVGSSCVEVPVANLSHALGFFFMRLLSVHVLIPICWLLPRCRVGRQLLSRRAVLQLPVSCASDTCPSCCSSHCEGRVHSSYFAHSYLGLRVSGMCRSHWGASFFHWLPRLSCRRKLHRSHDRAKSRANPHHLLLPRVVDVLKQGRAPCVLAGLLFHTMQPHAWQPHYVSVRRHRPSVLSRLEKRDCLTELCLCSIKFLLEVYHAISRREVFHGRKYDSR